MEKVRWRIWKKNRLTGEEDPPSLTNMVACQLLFLFLVPPFLNLFLHFHTWWSVYIPLSGSHLSTTLYREYDVVIFVVVNAGLQAFEMMAIAAVGNNLITYVFNDMHYPLSKAANIVTNFVGTVFLLSLLGGFLSDSYLGSFATMLIFGFVELSVSPYQNHQF